MDHSFNMKRMSDEKASETARKENLNVSFKSKSFKKSSEQKAENMLKSHEKKQKKVKKRLERMYKSCTNLWEEKKKQNVYAIYLTLYLL